MNETRLTHDARLVRVRLLCRRVGYKNCCFVHVALVPEMGSPGEQKTKPTQHSVKQMRALGEKIATMPPPALFVAAGASCSIICQAICRQCYPVFVLCLMCCCLPGLCYCSRAFSCSPMLCGTWCTGSARREKPCFHWSQRMGISAGSVFWCRGDCVGHDC